MHLKVSIAGQSEFRDEQLFEALTEFGNLLSMLAATSGLTLYTEVVED